MLPFVELSPLTVIGGPSVGAVGLPRLLPLAAIPAVDPLMLPLLNVQLARAGSACVAADLGLAKLQLAKVASLKPLSVSSAYQPPPPP